MEKKEESELTILQVETALIKKRLKLSTWDKILPLLPDLLKRQIWTNRGSEIQDILSPKDGEKLFT